MIEENDQENATPTVKEMARRIHGQLENACQRLRNDKSISFSLGIKGRLYDTIGLLNAISTGKLPPIGKQRIASNMLEVLEELDRMRSDKQIDSSSSAKVLSLACLEAIQQGAELGLTVEGYDFERKRGQSRY